VWFGRIWENQQELTNGKWSLWGAEKHQLIFNHIRQGDIMPELKNQTTLPLIQTHKTSSRYSRRQHIHSDNCHHYYQIFVSGRVFEHFKVFIKGQTNQDWAHIQNPTYWQSRNEQTIKISSLPQRHSENQEERSCSHWCRLEWKVQEIAAGKQQA
jgi:hypothetical protein